MIVSPTKGIPNQTEVKSDFARVFTKDLMQKSSLFWKREKFFILIFYYNKPNQIDHILRSLLCYLHILAMQRESKMKDKLFASLKSFYVE